jgi:hypothetical protein
LALSVIIQKMSDSETWSILKSLDFDHVAQMSGNFAVVHYDLGCGTPFQLSQLTCLLYQQNIANGR